MSVRTCGLDLSERILDAGIHCGKKNFNMDEPFYFFYWIFVDFFLSFLAKIEILKVYNMSWKGDSILDDIITI